MFWSQVFIRSYPCPSVAKFAFQVFRQLLSRWQGWEPGVRTSQGQFGHPEPVAVGSPEVPEKQSGIRLPRGFYTDSTSTRGFKTVVFFSNRVFPVARGELGAMLKTSEQLNFRETVVRGTISTTRANGCYRKTRPGNTG